MRGLSSESAGSPSNGSHSRYRQSDPGRDAIVAATRERYVTAYERLAGEPFASRVDWGRVHVWWTDERCVPPDDPRSNYGAAREALYIPGILVLELGRVARRNVVGQGSGHYDHLLTR